jgi:hypothetical protein
MKVLTIQEPYATMILEGKKTIETRTWKTNFRGLILLHTSKNPKSKLSGKIFAVAKIVDCKPMIKKDEVKACCEIYPRAYSWFLEEIRPTELKEVKGSLGLWELDCELKEKLKDGELYCLFG